MDIGFDINAWRPPSAAPAFDGGCGGAPEWLELRARLGAAWAARRELHLCDATPTVRSGSFNRNLAGELAGFELESPAVNRIALGNLKSGEGNADHCTGKLTPGGRG